MRTIQPLFFAPKWVPFATLICSLAALGSSSALGVTVVVTSTADVVTGCATTGTGAVGTGGCTLRDAITFSNANPPISPAQNLIQFNIPGSGVQTIELVGPLPAITTATIVDGYSQPGSSPNTLAVGDDAVLLVSIHGSVSVLHNSTVLEVNGGTGSLIRGLVIGYEFTPVEDGFPSGIVLQSCCNRIAGNFIGTDPTGSSATGGFIKVNSSDNVIGGPAPADRNVIGDDQIVDYDIGVFGDRNAVAGNYVGIDAAGSAALGFATPGIVVEGSSNVIGGCFPPTLGNVIGGRNAFQGPGIGMGGSRNVVAGNFIGTDATGTAPIPNWDGVLVGDSGNSGNFIGTASSRVLPGCGNRIAFNDDAGVLVPESGPFGGPYVEPVSVSILSNSIFSNGGLGIELRLLPLSPGAVPPGSVEPNDACDAVYIGPNNLQNFPVLTSAIATKNNTKIAGTLNSKPNKTYFIQLFSNSSCDPSGFGEGETLVGEVPVTTDASCNGSFKTSVSVADAPAGRFITATATDPEGNTSEFSACQQVVGIRALTRTRLIEGPIRVAPGVPVEFAFRVETTPPGMAGNLSGEAVISDDKGNLCRAQVSSTGEGACSLTFGRPGQYLVRAHYLGNSTFDDSTSPPVPVLVGMPGGR